MNCRRQLVSPRAPRSPRSSDCWKRGSCARGSPVPRGTNRLQSQRRRQEALRDGWLPLIEAGPSGDLDSDLRVALLAIWGGGDRRLAADFLRQSGGKKKESIAMTELISDAAAPLARWYTDLRSETAKAVLRAESEAIRAMADSLPQEAHRQAEAQQTLYKSQKVSEGVPKGSLRVLNYWNDLGLDTLPARPLLVPIRRPSSR